MSKFTDKIKLPGFLKKPKVRRILRKTAIAVLIVAIVLGGSGIFIGYYYEDTVKKLIITELNKRLTTRIEVKEIEFSLFKKFPYASVHFIDATVYNPVDSARLKKDAIRSKNFRKQHDNDTILLKADDIYLQFSILDLIFGKYRIKRIEVDDGWLKINIYKDGSDNYHFWKPSTDTVSDEGFSFDLQKLRIRNVAVRYVDHGEDMDFRLLAKDLMLKGKFRDEQYLLYIDGRTDFCQISVEGTNYFNSENTVVDVTLDVNETTGLYTFRDGDVEIGDMSFSVTGFVAWGDQRKEMDLKIGGKSLPLRSFLEELPEVLSGHLKGYRAEGDFNFEAVVKGALGDGRIPGFSASFSIQGGEILREKGNTRLEKVALTATFTNGEKQNASTSVLNISRCSAMLGDGSLRGSLLLTDFNKPRIELSAQAEFNLELLHRFLQADSLYAMNGDVQLDLKYSGTLNDINTFTASDFVNSVSSGQVSLAGGSLTFADNHIKLSELNGNFRFSNNDIIADQFSGKVGSSDFRVEGQFKNVFSFLFFKEEPLQADVSFVSDNLHIEDLLLADEKAPDTAARFKISDQLDLNLDVNIRQLSFEKFNATGIKGQIRISQSQLLARDIILHTAGGKLSATGMIDASHEGRFLVSCDAVINKVDISKMFYQFNNFGQQALAGDNLSGSLTAAVQFGGVWSSSLKPDLASIYALADIRIEDGELKNYEPVKGLSKYFKNRDFSRVKFSVLTTRIEIRDQVINIPKTEISSDAVNFTVYGTHGFDDQIDYHLSLLFSEFKRPTPVNENEFGVIEDDGTGRIRYFFRITGTTENPVYKTIDKKAYKEQIATGLKTEKQNLKEILNKEFGWFKKDSTGKKEMNPVEKKDDKKQEFILEWEEDDE